MRRSCLDRPCTNGASLLPGVDDARRQGWLYERLLNDEWAVLPEAILSAHFRGEPIRLRGFLEVEVGKTRLAGLLRRVFRLPARGGTVAARLEIAGGPDREVWSREIGDWRFSTVQTAAQGKLRERAGPLEFEFRLTRDGDRLCYRQEGLRLCLVGLPLRVPRCAALEAAAPAPYCTEIVVQVRAPAGGLLVGYRGKLRPEGAAR